MLARQHALLLAPTGYGKTEAALLPVLHHLLAERDRLAASDRPWPPGFKALYVTPLRALNRDLMRRLEHWAEALGITVGVRHGDTSQAERARQSRKPPDILITTPETMQLLLYGDTLRRHLGTVRFVIVDEVHDLAVSERGAQLSVALERIEEVIAQPARLREAKAKERVCPAAPSGGASFQRIGLSATVADPDAVARFLGGARSVEVLRAIGEKDNRLTVLAPADAPDVAAELSLPDAAAAQLVAVRDLVQRHERVLVFLNTRDSAELLTSRSVLLDDAPLLGLHHGSLSAEHRIETETQFRDGRLHGLVATSSLELGIDVGAIDHVIQVQSPRSVARMVQRLGRAGHRIGAISEGTLVSAGPEDHLECVAVARMAEAGQLEPLRVRENPLVVLANQLVALSNEYADLDPEWCRAVISRAGPFLELDEGMFHACWDTLIDVKAVFESDTAPGRFGRSGRARKHFLEHVSLIPDEKTYRIIDEASKRSIGTVDDAFVAAALRPGDPLVMAGRSWRVLEVEAEARRVRVAPSKDLGAIPQWSGQQLPVSAMLAQEVARLRGVIAEGRGTPEMVGAAEPIHRHTEQGLTVPTDETVTLDVGRGTIVACIALGTRGNEALGRITAGMLSQRSGTPVGMESDAYRIHFTVPATVRPEHVTEVWEGLDVASLDMLLAIMLRDQGVVKHHLVHVAKHFGAVPADLDPNRFTRARMDALWDRIALQEETLGRLIHERFDLEAVAAFIEALHAGSIRIVPQGMGPLSRLAGDEMRMHLAPRNDEKLLAEVRRRIEESDVLMVCTACRTRLEMKVTDVPARIHCRRCGRRGMACLRPWHADQMHILGGDGTGLGADELRERKRWIRNQDLVADFGPVAVRCLVARGVGPETATRILQKVADPASPTFWREILNAELEFARTNAFWSR